MSTKVCLPICTSVLCFLYSKYIALYVFFSFTSSNTSWSTYACFLLLLRAVNTKVDMRFNVKNAYWLSDRIREKIMQMVS